MTLQIKSIAEPVEVSQLIVLLSGQPKVGKTSLGFTSRKPLLLDFDAGVQRAATLGDRVENISSWDKIRGMSEDDLEPYETIVVDTVGRCLDVMSLDIIAQDPKMATRSGGLTRNGYGALKSGFAGWMRQLKSHGKDILLLSHTDEQHDDDRIIYRPQITGGSYKEVHMLADQIGYLDMMGKDRVIHWDPSDRYLAGNPAGFESPMPVPHPAEEPRFFAGVMDRIRESLESMSEESREAVGQVTEWKERIAGVEIPADLNTLIKEVNDGDHDLHEAAVKQIKSLLARHAKKAGWEWDGEAGGYAETEA